MEKKSVKTFSSLLAKDIPLVPSYIDGGILPKGGTLLFGGLSKIGKSFLALGMARSLACGENLYGTSFIGCEEGKVLVVEQEIGEIGLQDRTRKVFSGMKIKKVDDNLSYITKESTLLLDKQEGIDLLSEAIEDYQPNVLILDPIGKMHAYDENSAEQIGKLFNTFESFKKINPTKQLSIILTHHFKKPPQGQFAKDCDPLDPNNFRGSTRWFSDPDTVITCKILRVYDKTEERPWKYWTVRMRFNLRQDESPEDMVFSINELEMPGEKDGDGKVVYQYSINNENQKFQSKKKKVKNESETLKYTQNILAFRK